MSGRADRGSSRDSTFLAALIVATAVAELWLAWRYFGFLTGDDVEVLAEAFRAVLGFKYRAWDIRSLFVPDVVVAPFVWLGAKLGVRDVRTLVVFATLPSIIAAAISTILVHALAMRWTSDLRVARAAALLFALHWIPLGFASTVYPRTIAMLCVLLATWLVAQTTMSVPRALFAGVLCAIAFADRFSEIVFLVPILVVARRRALIVLAGFAAAVVLVVGAYDYATWGEWFGSIRKFAALTFVRSAFASLQKEQSALWYLFNIARWLSPALLPLLWFARRQRHLWLFVVIPLALLSLIPHKELRYLQGIVPFAALLAAIGFGAMRRRRLAVALLAIGIAWNLYGLRFLARKSMPAVEAAQALARDPSVKTVVMSQLWAYGDRLYFTDRIEVRDVGTPPRALAESIRDADAACLYDTDLTPEIRRTLLDAGYRPVRTFRDALARDIVVFRRVTTRESRNPQPPRRR
jgi:hypothetical protein